MTRYYIFSSSSSSFDGLFVFWFSAFRHLHFDFSFFYEKHSKNPLFFLVLPATFLHLAELELELEMEMEMEIDREERRTQMRDGTHLP